MLTSCITTTGEETTAYSTSVLEKWKVVHHVAKECPLGVSELISAFTQVILTRFSLFFVERVDLSVCQDGGQD